MGRELTHVLRAHGLENAREAFVFDWNRYLVDDPDMLSFYSFGFWNLLVPAFAAERPNPYRLTGNLDAFAELMRRQNARFIVVPRDVASTFPAFADVAQGRASLAGYAPIAQLTSDIVLGRCGDTASPCAGECAPTGSGSGH